MSRRERLQRQPGRGNAKKAPTQQVKWGKREEGCEIQEMQNPERRREGGRNGTIKRVEATPRQQEQRGIPK